MSALAIVLACVGAASGCAREPVTYRGAGLQAAALPPGDVAAIYRRALGTAFALDDPSLSLLVDPVLLPRTAGLSGGDPMPQAVRSVLERDGTVKGTCGVPVEKPRAAPVCRAARAGYIVRFSEPYALRPGRDSVQVYLVVQQYAIPRGATAGRLRFERAYQVARRGQTWRAVGEGRLPEP